MTELETITINLDLEISAPISELSLLELCVARNQWPGSATCATQESDGEILYWSTDVSFIKQCRPKAGNAGMITEVGFKHQIDAYYSDEDYPVCGYDWNQSIVTFEQYLNQSTN